MEGTTDQSIQRVGRRHDVGEDESLECSIKSPGAPWRVEYWYCHIRLKQKKIRAIPDDVHVQAHTIRLPDTVVPTEEE
jgi:hypothetical protein